MVGPCLFEMCSPRPSKLTVAPQAEGDASPIRCKLSNFEDEMIRLIHTQKRFTSCRVSRVECLTERLLNRGNGGTLLGVLNCYRRVGLNQELRILGNGIRTK